MVVYDAESMDRARPYLVKFAEGLDREKIISRECDDDDNGEMGKSSERKKEEKGWGFYVPKAFAMHFSAEEIELVASQFREKEKIAK